MVYGIVGVPLGHLADRCSRKRILAVCLSFWSVMTGICGFAKSFAHLFAARVAVGAGESGGPPASMSMISDLFGPQQRSTALGVLMSAAPLGIMLVSGSAAESQAPTAGARHSGSRACPDWY
ncbi:MAG: MFS transporter [Steroidobacteraceae bacterium]